ncbi:hypothetical protein AtEden1_Chr5g0130621 [Arabidopsis thaliana]
MVFRVLISVDLIACCFFMLLSNRRSIRLIQLLHCNIFRRPKAFFSRGFFSHRILEFWSESSLVKVQ